MNEHQFDITREACAQCGLRRSLWDGSSRCVTRRSAPDLAVNHKGVRVGTLSYKDGIYTYKYAPDPTHVILCFPDITETYMSLELFPVFSRGVMSCKRKDYIEHMERLGLYVGATPMEVLERIGPVATDLLTLAYVLA